MIPIRQLLKRLVSRLRLSPKDVAERKILAHRKYLVEQGYRLKRWEPTVTRPRSQEKIVKIEGRKHGSKSS